MRWFHLFPSSPRRRAILPILLIAASGMLLSGCDEENPGVTAVEPSAQTTGPDFQLPDQVRPDEAAFAALSREVPSSAGFYLDNGRLVVLVRDSVQFAAARARVLSLARSGSLGPESRTAHVVVERADYSFRQLAAWRDLIFETLLDTEAVTSLDLDEVQNRVTIGLHPEMPVAVRTALEEELVDSEIQPAAVEFIEHRPVTFESADSLADRFDQVKGGIRWSRYGTGSTGSSIGFTAYINSQPHMIVASHSTAGMWELDGFDAGQPWLVSANYVGYETIDPSGWTCNSKECRYTDASAHLIDGSRPAAVGQIARTYSRSHSSAGSILIDQSDPFFIIENASSAGLLAGTEVNKMGRMTGWTYGTITRTCVDHVSPDKIVLCQMEADYYSEGGDSGGAIFTRWQEGDAVGLVGVHSGIIYTFWGTYKVFSPYDQIADELAPSGMVAHNSPLTTPSLSGYIDGSYPVLSWTLDPASDRVHIFRETVDNVAGTTTGWKFLQTVSSVNNDYIDWEREVEQYYGTMNPGPRVAGYVAYRIYASSRAESRVSEDSEVIYFSTPGEGWPHF